MSSFGQVRAQPHGQIGWESHGLGADLVLVHGSLSDRSCWEPLLPHLAAHRVHAVDRRGRGLSASAPPAADLESEVRDLAAVLAAIGGRPALCGWSFGAVVALEAALGGCPVSALVLYDPPLGTARSALPPGFASRFGSLVASGQPESAASLFLAEALELPAPLIGLVRQGPGWPALVAAAVPGAAEMAALDGYRHRPLMTRRCEVPALVLAGSLSPEAVRTGARSLAADLPAGRLAVLEGHHHFAFMADPAMFARIVEEFLAEVASAGRP